MNYFKETNDWKTEGDYDPPDVEWLVTTTLSATMEEQTSMCGKCRHRNRVYGSPWLEGPAPNEA